MSYPSGSRPHVTRGAWQASTGVTITATPPLEALVDYDRQRARRTFGAGRPKRRSHIPGLVGCCILSWAGLALVLVTDLGFLGWSAMVVALVFGVVESQKA